MHPSLLPAYRGRAPLNWAILNGETTLGLTAHWVNETVDGGNIVHQVKYHLSRSEDVADALIKLYPLYESLTSIILHQLMSNSVISVVQDDSKSTILEDVLPKTV